MPFELVDVNVHPAKLEVRFQNGGQIYSQLLSTVRNRFLTTDLTAHAQLNKTPADEFRPFPDQGLGNQGWAMGLPGPMAPSENQEKIPFQNSGPAYDWTQAPRQPFPLPNPSEPPRQAGSMEGLPAGNTASEFGGDMHLSGDRIDAPGDGYENPPVSPSRTATALQVHNTYLISETEEGMLVIDQHALHERIIYEQIRDKVVEGKLESQKLLVPEPVSLPPAEAAAVLEQSPLLAQLGITVEPFGGDTVLVSAYPAMLANHNPAEMLRGVVDQIDGGDETA